MALRCGIVGLPNVGKSTLFNSLSNAKAQSANFPFCTIDPNVGTINVPDNRLELLAKLVSSDKIIPTTVEIVDIAGLVKGASKGEGLGNKFLANIRETNAIIHVLRCFDDENIIHVDGIVNPVRDKETIDLELQLKDLETLQNFYDKNFRAAQSGDKQSQKILVVVKKCMEFLEKGSSLRALILEDDEISCVNNLNLLTFKPVLYVCNVDAGSVLKGNRYVTAVKESVKDESSEVILIATAIEADIAEFEDFDERKFLLNEIGLSEPGVNYLIQATYKLLNLQTFFTAGKKEVKAWTVTKGTKAPQAAGVIHTDFENGFIRAEVISFNDFINLKSEQACRDAGKLISQGKEYVVCEGDIIHFRFNV